MDGQFKFSDALRYGKAGEHLVCADLLSKGYEAFLTGQGMSYDVVCDFEDRLLRVQVKACVRPGTRLNGTKSLPAPTYIWNIRRRGKGGNQRLTDTECDLVALCALDIKTVAYFPVDKVKQTMSLRVPGGHFSGFVTNAGYGCVDEYPFEVAVSPDEWALNQRRINQVRRDRQQVVKVHLGKKNVKLDEAKVADIKRRLDSGEKGRDLAKEFGVSEPAICSINKGNTWSYVNPY